MAAAAQPGRPQPQAPRQRFRSSVGGNSQVPNVYWQALTGDQLRRYHNFVALPPVDKVHVNSPETFRYVRQQDELWQALHAGALTTSKLPGALGLREPEAARAINGPLGRTALLEAYFHLLEPAWQPSGAGPGSSSTSTARQAVRHNEEARRRYNVQLGPGTAAAVQTGDQGPTEEDKRRVCEVLALRGPLAVRLCWGTVQEPSSLHVLLQLFPGTRLEEVGMYCVSPELMCSQWGFQAGELPRLGASPDAVLCHRLSIQSAEIQAGVAAMQQLLGPSAAPPSAGLLGGPAAAASELRPDPETGYRSGVRSGAGSRSQGVEAAARVVAEELLQRAVEGALKLPLGDGVLGGGGEEADEKLAASSATSNIAEGGGMGSLQQCWGDAVQAVAERLVQAFGAAAAGSSGAAGAPALQVEVREVVEVKNHCPFAFRSQHRSKKGPLQLEYRLADSGPIEQVRPAWVPQLQMHCLAAGAPSALLLSRSATRGIRLFRVRRDDTYIRLMLQSLRTLHVDHVRRQLPPDPSLFQRAQGHTELLELTLEIAERAALLAHVAGPELQQAQGTDGNAFWGPPSGRRR